MRRKIIHHCFGMVALLAALLLMARLDVKATPEEDNKEVSKLLEDIKSQAADLQRDSDELEAFTRSDVSWQSYADELERIKERINTIGKTISKLQSLENSASPWQREAIERIIPVAQKLASNTTAAIEHLRKDPAENPRAAVSRVPKVQCRSRIESGLLDNRLRGVWKDADHVGSVPA